MPPQDERDPTSLQCCLPPSSSIMYFRTIYALFFTFAGIVHATAVNHLPGLLRPRSAHTAMPRRALTVKPLQSRTANSRIVGTLFGRQSGCEAGYTPCLGDSESCCPPDCLECGDNAATCCDIGRCYLFTICLFGAFTISSTGTFCSTDSSGQPACECFGSLCPDGSSGSSFTTSASFAGATGASANDAPINIIPGWPLALGVSMIAFALCAYMFLFPDGKSH